MDDARRSSSPFAPSTENLLQPDLAAARGVSVVEEDVSTAAALGQTARNGAAIMAAATDPIGAAQARPVVDGGGTPSGLPSYGGDAGRTGPSSLPVFGFDGASGKGPGGTAGEMGPSTPEYAAPGSFYPPARPPSFAPRPPPSFFSGPSNLGPPSPSPPYGPPGGMPQSLIRTGMPPQAFQPMPGSYGQMMYGPAQGMAPMGAMQGQGMSGQQHPGLMPHQQGPGGGISNYRPTGLVLGTVTPTRTTPQMRPSTVGLGSQSAGYIRPMPSPFAFAHSQQQQLPQQQGPGFAPPPRMMQTQVMGGEGMPPSMSGAPTPSHALPGVGSSFSAPSTRPTTAGKNASRAAFASAEATPAKASSPAGGPDARLPLTPPASALLSPFPSSATNLAPPFAHRRPASRFPRPPAPIPDELSSYFEDLQDELERLREENEGWEKVWLGEVVGIDPVPAVEALLGEASVSDKEKKKVQEGESAEGASPPKDVSTAEETASLAEEKKKPASSSTHTPEGHEEAHRAEESRMPPPSTSVTSTPSRDASPVKRSPVRVLHPIPARPPSPDRSLPGTSIASPRDSALGGSTPISLPTSPRATSSGLGLHTTGAGASTGTTLADLRSSSNAVLGLRLLQRLREVQAENEELGEMLGRIVRDGLKGRGDGNGNTKEGLEGRGGGKAWIRRMDEERKAAEERAEELSLELEEAHALIASLDAELESLHATLVYQTHKLQVFEARHGALVQSEDGKWTEPQVAEGVQTMPESATGRGHLPTSLQGPAGPPTIAQAISSSLPRVHSGKLGPTFAPVLVPNPTQVGGAAESQAAKVGASSGAQSPSTEASLADTSRHSQQVAGSAQARLGVPLAASSTAPRAPRSQARSQGAGRAGEGVGIGDGRGDTTPSERGGTPASRRQHVERAGSPSKGQGGGGGRRRRTAGGSGGGGGRSASGADKGGEGGQTSMR